MYSGSLEKVLKYLEKWGFKLNLDKINIDVVDGTWTLNVFGYAYKSPSGKIFIAAYAPKWTFFLKDWANALILKHELGHICGIVECESFFKCFCLMYEAPRQEDNKNKEKWWWEIAVMPFQLIFLHNKATIF